MSEDDPAVTGAEAKDSVEEAADTRTWVIFRREGAEEYGLVVAEEGANRTVELPSGERLLLEDQWRPRIEQAESLALRSLRSPAALRTWFEGDPVAVVVESLRQFPVAQANDQIRERLQRFGLELPVPRWRKVATTLRKHPNIEYSASSKKFSWREAPGEAVSVDEPALVAHPDSGSAPAPDGPQDLLPETVDSSSDAQRIVHAALRQGRVVEVVRWAFAAPEESRMRVLLHVTKGLDGAETPGLRGDLLRHAVTVVEAEARHGSDGRRRVQRQTSRILQLLPEIPDGPVATALLGLVTTLSSSGKDRSAAYRLLDVMTGRCDPKALAAGVLGATRTDQLLSIIQARSCDDAADPSFGVRWRSAIAVTPGLAQHLTDPRWFRRARLEDLGALLADDHLAPGLLPTLGGVVRSVIDRELRANPSAVMDLNVVPPELWGSVSDRSVQDAVTALAPEHPLARGVRLTLAAASEEAERRSSVLLDEQSSKHMTEVSDLRERVADLTRTMEAEQRRSEDLASRLREALGERAEQQARKLRQAGLDVMRVMAGIAAEVERAAPAVDAGTLRTSEVVEAVVRRARDGGVVRHAPIGSEVELDATLYDLVDDVGTGSTRGRVVDPAYLTSAAAGGELVLNRGRILPINHQTAS